MSSAAVLPEPVGRSSTAGQIARLAGEAAPCVLAGGKAREQVRLPRKRVDAPDGPEEGGEILVRQLAHPASPGRARGTRPRPEKRPAPRITGPRTGSSNWITACVSCRLARLPGRRQRVQRGIRPDG